MTLKFKDDEEMGQSFLKSVEVLTKVRSAEKFWREHYGHEALRQKKKAEEAADKYLEELKQIKSI